MDAMESIPFDTHRFVKRMTGVGMPLGQAEELADTLAGEQKGLFDTNRTMRRDIGQLRQDVEEVKHGLTVVKDELVVVKEGLATVKGELGVVKAELGMVKWIASGGGVGIMLLLIRSFWPL